jgi:hypothetical protein
MARSIQQIKQDIVALEGIVTEVAEEFQGLYGKYIDLLLQSVQKQLILAIYQICTQIYPDSFLRLSLNQKQNLQQSIRKISQEFVVNMRQNLENTEEEEQDNGKILEQMLKNLPFLQPTAKEVQEEQENFNELKEQVTEHPQNQSELVNEELPKPQFADISAIIEPLEESNELSFEKSEVASTSSNIDIENSESEKNHLEENKSKEPEKINLPNPEYLIIWQRRVEKIIKKNLDDTSKKANKYLQEVNIIPSRLPTKIIDVALQAEEVSGGGNKFYHLANILNLMIETEKEQKGKQSGIQISLLRLRLSEIEFADPILSSQRNQIREFVVKIDKLRQQYQAKQKEYAIAEAEAAWRSSWYED